MKTELSPCKSDDVKSPRLARLKIDIRDSYGEIYYEAGEVVEIDEINPSYHYPFRVGGFYLGPEALEFLPPPNDFMI